MVIPAQAQVNEISQLLGSNAMPLSMRSSHCPNPCSAGCGQRGQGNGPVIVLDHYDNTASGGTMDTTEVLSAVLDAGLPSSVFGFFDPKLWSKWQPLVSGLVTVELGGKPPMPSPSRASH